MFKLLIETDSEAFGTTPGERQREVAGILRNLAFRFEVDYEGDEGTARDSNGNKVAAFVMEA